MKGFTPRFVAVADGEDDFGLRVEGREVLVDVAAWGVEGGEIASACGGRYGLDGIWFLREIVPRRYLGGW